ncbi:MAG: 3-deoxy-manno-octulosonate cytidylyltransferase [Mariprofundaceae bacterium]|nr:3-deoxy-manno-octulosonate cytidylyltransferase [Mariprofundaceae bacterium]
MKIIVAIPARYESTRFPGKPLALLAGKPMIQHVVDRALAAEVGEVVVCTDDVRIAQAVDGAVVCMTSPDHQSGSDRISEMIEEYDCDLVINVQGDEPLIQAKAIRQVVQPLFQNDEIAMATLAHPIHRQEELDNPNVVKVVCDAQGNALYFSRAAIPYPRTRISSALRHIGLYAYRRDFLLSYAKLSSCAAEEAEQLEQLRVLYHGYKIAVSVGDFACQGVDTPQDLLVAEAALLANKRV